MDDKEKHECDCGCDCGENCDCGCGENCTCGENCECGSGGECDCGENCSCSQQDEAKYQTSLEGKVLEYLQTAQRLQAEFDNYRKRAEEQIKQARFDGMADAVSKLLPALDSFESASKMVNDPKLLEGFDLIKNQILSAFTALGVEKIDAKNTPFNPTLHNALATQSNPDFDDDIVIEEYQAGYKLKDKIIRYSQVIVNKKEEN